MKAISIIRRIDDLGRVVIPREIRHTLHIKEGDPLEIYLDDEGGVVFRKYEPNYIQSLYSAFDDLIKYYKAYGTAEDKELISKINTLKDETKKVLDSKNKYI